MYFNPETGYPQQQPYTGTVPFKLSEMVSSGFDGRGAWYCGGRDDMQIVKDLKAAGYTEWKYKPQPDPVPTPSYCFEPEFRIEVKPPNPPKPPKPLQQQHYPQPPEEPMTHEELPPIFDLLRLEEFAKKSRENYFRLAQKMATQHEQKRFSMSKTIYEIRLNKK